MNEPLLERIKRGLGSKDSQDTGKGRALATYRAINGIVQKKRHRGGRQCSMQRREFLISSDEVGSSLGGGHDKGAWWKRDGSY